MRRKEKMITEDSVIEKVLNQAAICRLGLIDGEYAYIVPVHFAHNKGCLYMHSANEGKKIELIRQNPRVSFEVEDDYAIITSSKPCGWTTKYRSAMGTGIIEIETNQEEKKKALDQLMEKYGARKPYVYDEKNLEKMVILKLKILSISGKQSGDYQ